MKRFVLGRDATFHCCSFLRQKTVFVEPAKRDVHRRRRDIFRLARDDLPEPGFGLASVHLRFEAQWDVAVTPELGTIRLVLVDVEMAAPFLDVLADQNNPAFAVSVTAHVTPPPTGSILPRTHPADPSVFTCS